MCSRKVTKLETDRVSKRHIRRGQVKIISRHDCSPEQNPWPNRVIVRLKFARSKRGMPLTLTDTIQLKKELKPAIKPFSVMECVHSVLTDNAAFGACYEKGAVRILTAFGLHYFRALPPSVV